MVESLLAYDGQIAHFFLQNATNVLFLVETDVCTDLASSEDWRLMEL